jgi:hypothetical protein
MYFTICSGPGLRYKLFQNTLYKSVNTLNREINVLWPVQNVEAEKLRMNRNSSINVTSYIRKCNDTLHNLCKWSFTGSNLEVMVNGNKIVAPVIEVTSEGLEKLPYNGYSFVPKGEIPSEGHVAYLEPHLYSTDPTKGFVHMAPSAPMAPMAPMAPSASIPVAPLVTPSSKNIPTARPCHLAPHIVKIVLAESIRKNELCPITSDPITESSTVTPCGHVFSKDGIEKWLQSSQSKGLCPLCKNYILF